jgi:hypothetical protein
MYQARQRELRERRLHAEREQRHWLSDGVAAVEVEEQLEFESPTSSAMPRSAA